MMAIMHLFVAIVLALLAGNENNIIWMYIETPPVGPFLAKDRLPLQNGGGEGPRD